MQLLDGCPIPQAQFASLSILLRMPLDVKDDENDVAKNDNDEKEEDAVDGREISRLANVVVDRDVGNLDDGEADEAGGPSSHREESKRRPYKFKTQTTQVDKVVTKLSRDSFSFFWIIMDSYRFVWIANDS